MTTVEIAERTGKEHKNVLADARKMLLDLGLRSAEFSANVPDKYGRDRDALALPKRECLILVSGYSIELRAAIIDRWQELEQTQAPRIPPHQEALRLAADYLDRAQGGGCRPDQLTACANLAFLSGGQLGTPLGEPQAPQPGHRAGAHDSDARRKSPA